MTSRSDESAPRRSTWLWVASLSAIVLFFLLLVSVALQVQRAAELALAQDHRALSEIVQRSTEVELATERLLNEQERLAVRSGGLAGEPTGSAVMLVLLGPVAPSHARAHGAVTWDAARRHGQLLVAGLPAVSEPHEYEVRVGATLVPGSRFDRTESGIIRVELPSEAGAALAGADEVQLVLRHHRPDGTPTETIVLRTP